VCVGLFLAGLLIGVDDVDARECRQMAAILCIGLCCSAPAMRFREFLARSVRKGWWVSCMAGRAEPDHCDPSPRGCGWQLGQHISHLHVASVLGRSRTALPHSGLDVLQQDVVSACDVGSVCVWRGNVVRPNARRRLLSGAGEKERRKAPGWDKVCVPAGLLHRAVYGVFGVTGESVGRFRATGLLEPERACGR